MFDGKTPFMCARYRQRGRRGATVRERTYLGRLRRMKHLADGDSRGVFIFPALAGRLKSTVSRSRLREILVRIGDLPNFVWGSQSVSTFGVSGEVGTLEPPLAPLAFGDAPSNVTLQNRAA